MWASGHNGDIRRAAHGYVPTHEVAMAAFAESPPSGGVVLASPWQPAYNACNWARRRLCA
jgi:hypothetical protein